MPVNLNLSDPSSLGMSSTHNLYLTSQPGVTLGVWHILPASCDNSQLSCDDQLRFGQPVVLYLHGNTAHRAAPSRVELYKVLRHLDYHVVTFDYRGFADSSNVAPGVTGVVADARAVYDWVVARSGQDMQVIVWGHSLGAGVATHLVADLCTQGTRPSGLVLESPFNNIYDELRNHHFAWPWRSLPWFDWFFTSSLAENDLAFTNDEKVSLIDVPLLILHAQDDAVIPFKLGKALHEAALKSRKVGGSTVEFREFDGKHGYGHSWICRAPELPDIVKQFVKGCQDRKKRSEN
eukprot:TRINITY_DN33969_c0_g1_i1.p1 TRINITY_DN33969_c0_g1~~TRINITY_DN33969_c0_g1_i1.p1  ORF type:complete len:339 (-),score=88.32 TRINITY_DN33969_c0_g1_i1:69-944(-)